MNMHMHDGMQAFVPESCVAESLQNGIFALVMHKAHNIPSNTIRPRYHAWRCRNFASRNRLAEF